MRRVFSVIAAALLTPLAVFAADTYIAGADNDPDLRAAQYQSDENRYFSAITELLALNRAGSLSAGRYQWLLAEDCPELIRARCRELACSASSA